MRSPPRRAAGGWSALDLAEAFHLACALAALERLGVMASLDRPAEVRTLARRHRADAGMLEAALRLVADGTNLVARRGTRYRATPQYDAHARFMLRQYVGAYGANGFALHRTLRDRAIAGRLIDRAAHAAAFGEAGTLSSKMVADLVVQLGFTHVLDLGCGTGTMLHDLAGRIPGFIGWGLDVSPSMCTAARRRVSEAAAGRIRIFRGDCRQPQAALPASVVTQVATVTACNLANEFFADGVAAAAAWLAALKNSFPDRTALIADYYGRPDGRRGRRSRHLALHDFVQIISGQGVPPASLAGWNKIYRAARCTLVHALEDRETGSFVHILRL